MTHINATELLPVSETLKKKVNVMPSVRVRATMNSENGGSSRAWFNAAKVIASMTYGATILKICAAMSSETEL